MRRTTLTGRANIQKRCPIPAAAFNLSILMKATIALGNPKPLAAGKRVGKTGPPYWNSSPLDGHKAPSTRLERLPVAKTNFKPRPDRNSPRRCPICSTAS